MRAFSEDVSSLLLGHHWPGNVRELRNLVERAVIFSEGDRIDLSVIPEQYRKVGESGGAPLDVRYQTSAREVLLEALQKSHGVKRKAAELLKIDRKTLYRKLKSLGIQRGRESGG